MSIKAPGYNVSAAVAAGFVKNDGAGNFSFGEAGGGGGGGSGWDLIETKDITAATTSVSFTGLNGDVDKYYQIVYVIEKPITTASNSSYVLRPNGISTNQNTIERNFSSSGGVGTNLFSDLRLAGGGLQANIQMLGSFFFEAQTGNLIRQMMGSKNTFSTGQLFNFGRVARVVSASIWEDSTTNITSFDIVANFANIMGVGSTFSLYKLSV